MDSRLRDRTTLLSDQLTITGVVEAPQTPLQLEARLLLILNTNTHAVSGAPTELPGLVAPDLSLLIDQQAHLNGQLTASGTITVTVNDTPEATGMLLSAANNLYSLRHTGRTSTSTGSITISSRHGQELGGQISAGGDGSDLTIRASGLIDLSGGLQASDQLQLSVAAAEPNTTDAQFGLQQVSGSQIRTTAASSAISLTSFDGQTLAGTVSAAGVGSDLLITSGKSVDVSGSLTATDQLVISVGGNAPGAVVDQRHLTLTAPGSITTAASASAITLTTSDGQLLAGTITAGSSSGTSASDLTISAKGRVQVLGTLQARDQLQISVAAPDGGTSFTSLGLEVQAVGTAIGRLITTDAGSAITLNTRHGQRFDQGSLVDARGSGSDLTINAGEAAVVAGTLQTADQLRLTVGAQYPGSSAGQFDLDVAASGQLISTDAASAITLSTRYGQRIAGLVEARGIGSDLSLTARELLRLAGDLKAVDQLVLNVTSLPGWSDPGTAFGLGATGLVVEAAGDLITTGDGSRVTINTDHSISLEGNLSASGSGTRVGLSSKERIQIGGVIQATGNQAAISISATPVAAVSTSSNSLIAGRLHQIELTRNGSQIGRLLTTGVGSTISASSAHALRSQGEIEASGLGATVTLTTGEQAEKAPARSRWLRLMRLRPPGWSPPAAPAARGWH